MNKFSTPMMTSPREQLFRKEYKGHCQQPGFIRNLKVKISKIYLKKISKLQLASAYISGRRG